MDAIRETLDQNRGRNMMIEEVLDKIRNENPDLDVILSKCIGWWFQITNLNFKNYLLLFL